MREYQGGEGREGRREEGAEGWAKVIRAGGIWGEAKGDMKSSLGQPAVQAAGQGTVVWARLLAHHRQINNTPP